MSKRELRTCLAVLEAATGHAFTQEQTQVWFDLLQDVTPEALKAAVKRVLLEREYPGRPPIGLIRRYATEASHGVPAAAEQAFERVREAVSKFGYPDPAGAAAYCGSEIWKVIQGIGGWERICDSPIDQRQSLFAQFRDGWHRSQERRQQELRLPADVRPQQRLPDKTQTAIRIVADSFDAEIA